jgi:hypothetical protein
VPWARYSFDLGHNFVLAHGTCNNDKSDRLPAVPHLERWSQRNRDRGRELGERFNHAGLVHDLPATQQVTRWAYAQAEVVGAQVWLQVKDMLTPLDPSWRSALDGMAAGDL